MNGLEASRRGSSSRTRRCRSCRRGRRRDLQVPDVRCMAGGDHLACPDPHRLHVRLARRKRANHLGVIGADQIPVRVGLAPHDHRSHQPPAVRHGRIGVEQLQWRDGDCVLPDPRLRQLPGEDARASLCLGPRLADHGSRRLAGELDPALLAEPELVRPLPEVLDSDAQPPSDRRRCPSSSQTPARCSGGRIPDGSSRTGTAPSEHPVSGSTHRLATSGSRW